MHPIILVILAIVILSILVLVHEFGHFVAARMAGVWVEEFGIGLPPRAWGKKFRETIYSINWLPLGGFVRLHGESADMKVTKPALSFSNKSKGARAFIAIAGIVMNFWFAWVCFSLMFTITGIPKGVSVEEVEENSPAALAGIQTGDTIWSVNKKQIIGTEEFLMAVRGNRGKEIELAVKHEGEDVPSPVSVNVRQEVEEGQGFTGIVYKVESPVIERPGLLQAPFTYLYYGGRETIKWSVITVQAFATLFSDLGAGKVPQGLAGPFGVTLTIAEVIRYGIVAVLSFTGIISVNLAIINIVPFPPLDGSRIFLLGVEAIVGKRNVQKVEGKILNAGMIVLLLLILVLTLREIPKLISAGSLTGFVNSIMQ